MLRLPKVHGSSITTLHSTNPIGMRSFPVNKDNACLHFSLFFLTQFGQESTHWLTVCLTVSATTGETEPCLTSYGIVRESYEAISDWRHTSSGYCFFREQPASQKHVQRGFMGQLSKNNAEADRALSRYV